MIIEACLYGVSARNISFSPPAVVVKVEENPPSVSNLYGDYAAIHLLVYCGG